MSTFLISADGIPVVIVDNLYAPAIADDGLLTNNVERVLYFINTS